MTAVATVSMQPKVISSHLCWSVMTADNDFFLSFQVPSSLPFFLPSNLPTPRAQAAKVKNGYNCFYCLGVASCFPSEEFPRQGKRHQEQHQVRDMQGRFWSRHPKLHITTDVFVILQQRDQRWSCNDKSEYFWGLLQKLVQDVDDLLTLKKHTVYCNRTVLVNFWLWCEWVYLLMHWRICTFQRSKLLLIKYRMLLFFLCVWPIIDNNGGTNWF